MSLVRTGGFAGLRRAGELDTADLGDADAAEVAALVDSLVAALDAPPGTAGRPRGADRFHYEVTVDGGGGPPRVLSVADADLAPDVRGLLGRLEARVTSSGHSGRGGTSAGGAR